MDIFQPFQTFHTDDGFLDKLTSVNMQPFKIKNDFTSDFTEWYRRVINRATMIIEEFEYKSGLTHTCQPCCNSCCYHLVEIYEYELVAILTFLKNTNQVNVLDSAALAADLINKRLSKSPYVNSSPLESELIEYKLKYRSLQIPCIFQKDKKCLIYQVRPTCCVTYYSYGLLKDCKQKRLLPQECISYGHIEDWITEQILAFLQFNVKRVPKNFTPFNINVLTTWIHDYLVKNEINIPEQSKYLYL